jgi:uncharacterized protein (TIGR03000 family)
MSGYYEPQSGSTPTRSITNEQLNQPLNTTPRDGTTPPTPQSRPTGERPMPQASLQVPATIVVTLPADARLSIEDEPTRATTGERVFVSPPLEPGKTYTYKLKAEVDRNGEKKTTTQNVEVRAGETSRVAVDFPNPETRK